MRYAAYLTIIAIIWVGYSVLLGEQIAPEVHPTEVVLGAVVFFISLCTAVAITIGCIMLPIFCAPRIYRRFSK